MWLVGEGFWRLGFWEWGRQGCESCLEGCFIGADDVLGVWVVRWIRSMLVPGWSRREEVTGEDG